MPYTQPCRIKPGPTRAAALRPFRNRPTATDEKTRKLLAISVMISLVGIIAEKSLKLSPPDVVLKLKCTKFDSSGAPPQTSLGELTRNPQTLELDLRGLLLRGRRGEEGKE